MSDRSLPVNFLVSIREDALADLDRFRSDIPWMLDTRLSVRPLSDEAASTAITGPVAEFNRLCAPDAQVEIEDELVSAVLDEVWRGQVGFDQDSPTPPGAEGEGGSDEHRPQRVATPYLQLVMATVWDKEIAEGSHVLRLSTLKELGGAQEIVNTHLNGVLADLSPEQKDLAAKIFDHLVTPSGTKIALRFTDLTAYAGGSADEVEKLVKQLESGEQRILKPVAPPPGVQEPDGAEIFHDVLAPAIVTWRTGQHDAQLQRDKHNAEQEAARQHRRAQISIALAGIALVMLVVAGVAFLYANSQRAQANNARDTARSQVLGSEALADYQGRLGLGLRLAAQAYRTALTGEARDALLGGLIRTEGMVGYLKAQAGPINAVAFDPNGKLVASGSADGTVVLWNYRSGARLPLKGQSPGINGVAFSPDGTKLAAATDAGTVILWSVASQDPLRTLAGHAGLVYGVAFAPRGNIVASANQDGSVILWSVASGRRLRTLRAAPSPVNGVAFSANGDVIAAADADGRTILWSATTGRQLGVLDNRSAVTGVAFSPKSSEFATADNHGSVILWNAATGQRVRELTAGDGLPVESVAFSPDGKEVVTGGADDAVRTWNVANGHVLTTFQSHTATVESVAFSPDGTLVASGSADESVILSDATPVDGARTLDANRGPVYSVAFGAKGATLAAANGDRTISLWDTSTGKLLHVFGYLNIGNVESVAFSQDGKDLAAAGSDGRVEVADLVTQTPPRTFSDGGGGDGLTSVAFSPDGRILAAASDSGGVFLWDTRTGKRLHDLRDQKGVVNAVVFSPNGTTLASAGSDGTIVLWDLSTGRRLRTLLGSGAPVEDVAFSPGGDRLASASDDDSVTVWDVATGQVRAQLQGHQATVYTVAFSPNGKRLASGSADDTVIIWDIATRLGQPVGTQDNVVNSVAFSPNGKLLASGSADGTIVLYSSLPTVKSPAAIYERLCSVVRSNLTHTQWRLFLPGLPYEKTCPGYPS